MTAPSYRFHTLATRPVVYDRGLLATPNGGALVIVYDRGAIMREASRQYALELKSDAAELAAGWIKAPTSRRVLWVCAMKSAWAVALGERAIVDVRRGRVSPVSAREARELSTDGRL